MNICLFYLKGIYYFVIWYCLEIRYCCVNKKLLYGLYIDISFLRIRIVRNIYLLMGYLFRISEV